MRKRTVTGNGESGVALLSAILILMLMSALLIGFIAMVNSDQAASGINRDQTQAYAAAHAGVEKLTADLGQLFQANFAPTGAQVNAADGGGPGADAERHPVPAAERHQRLPDHVHSTSRPPTATRDTPVERHADQRRSVSGPDRPHHAVHASRSPPGRRAAPKSGCAARCRRSAIPVFQFGIFSENDLSFFAGPNFAFGGRVHTNQHLFLKQDSGDTLTLQDRVTAVGEIIRRPPGQRRHGTHPATVRMALAAGCPAAPAAINASCRNLRRTEGSVVDHPSAPR